MDPRDVEQRIRVAERAEQLAKERMAHADGLSEEEREELERRSKTARRKLVDAIRDVELAEGFDPPSDEPASFHDRTR